MILHKLTGFFFVLIAVGFFSMVVCYGNELEIIGVMIPAALMTAVGIQQMTRRVE